LQLAAKAFVREKKGIRWCPGKECDYAIKAELTLPKEVRKKDVIELMCIVFI
jgi:hypothetical protein